MPGEMKLPEGGEFLTSQFLKWFRGGDPPYLLNSLSADAVVNIAKIRLQYLADLTRIEIQAKELEGKMFQDVAQAISKAKK